ncbi:MAG: hypothetical protein OES99_03520 [Gammaproteobacteria bacterium]|nr:hypothetical protein [Gammaproteobacteria bacterium]
MRKFGQLSSLVDGGSVWLFRTVELIDLDPYAQAYVTHYSRIVALFDITTDHDEFFLLDKSMQAIPVLPGSKPPDSDVTEVARRLAASSNSRHALSVTLKNNRGLIYFQPFVVGGETLSDVDSLYSIAKNMCDELSGNV